MTNETLRRQRRLVVHVVDPLGMPLPGATVTLEQAGKKVSGLDTDASGHAMLEDLALESGHLRVDLQGFRRIDVPVRLRPGCLVAVLAPMRLGRLANTDPIPATPRRP